MLADAALEIRTEINEDAPDTDQEIEQDEVRVEPAHDETNEEVGEEEDEDVFQDAKAKEKKRRRTSDNENSTVNHQNEEVTNEYALRNGAQLVHIGFALSNVATYFELCKRVTLLCPVVRQRAKPSDIRFIFAVNFTAVDNTDMEKALEARDEAVSKYTALEKQYSELQRKLTVLERELSFFKPQKLAGFPLKCIRSVPLAAHDKSMRVGAASWFHSSMLYVAHSAVSATAGDSVEFGVTSVDLNARQDRSFRSLHCAAIRDIKVQSRNGSHDKILSTGLDKTLRLKSFESDASQITINLPTGGWSCTFDSHRDEIVYCGLSNTAAISMYDLRNPSQILATLSHPEMGGMGKGVHSLAHVESKNALVGANLGTAFFLEQRGAVGEGASRCLSTVSQEKLECVSIPKGGNVCISATYNESTNNFLTTWRAQDKLNHVIGSFLMSRPTVNNANPDLEASAILETKTESLNQDPNHESSSPRTMFKHIAEYQAKPNMNMTRTRAFSRPVTNTSNGGESVCVYATGSDLDACAYLHFERDGVVKELQKLPGVEKGAKVMDIVPVGGGRSGANSFGAVCVLTDSIVHVWQ
ncbi:hypothetical protein CcCBS67573_g02596 [Chytriomyces confervae]|uniref:RING-type E3 ubiquitin transferase n=1 Tax=Chytriomyces confervae TaxID=246404 RepID=A0A507FIU7_9FUNG|nr:hypothetical protein CcCBS67573_g02596 [Chytriomyces confervae]